MGQSGDSASQNPQLGFGPSSNEEKLTAATLEASVTGLQGCWDFPAALGGPWLNSPTAGPGFHPGQGTRAHTP